jgi:protein TonB
VNSNSTNPKIVKLSSYSGYCENIEITTAISDSADGPATIGPVASQGTGNALPIADYGHRCHRSATTRLPEFPGGAKFYTYIGKNFESPEINGEKTSNLCFFWVEKEMEA